MATNDLYGGLDEASLHALLGSIGDVGTLNDLNDQLASARKLRDTTVSSTLDDSPSHVVNTAGILGSILDRYQGGKDETQAKADRDAVYADQAKNNETFIRTLMGLRNNAAAPVPGQAGGAPVPYNSAADPSNIFAPR
jgi:hypothetical protein